MPTVSAPAVPVRFVPVKNSGYSQADIDRFGPILYKLATELGGLDPTQLYDWIKAHPNDPRSQVLQGYFIEDPEVAQRLWNIQVVQEQIRAVAFVFKTPQGEEVTIRALHYVVVRREVADEEQAETEEGADPNVSRPPRLRPAGVYMTISQVAAQPALEAQILQQLKRELASLEARLERYQKVFPNAKRLKKLLNAIRALFET